MKSFAKIPVGQPSGPSLLSTMSNDVTMTNQSQLKVPTEYAVATFVTNQAQAVTVGLIQDLNATYRTVLYASGSHTAAKVAGTYGMGAGDVLAVSGTGTLYPLSAIYLHADDYPVLAYGNWQFRIRAQLYTNDVAPTGNFTFGLYPFTRPGTSGGSGLCIYTIGTVVTGSNGATFTTPAADGLHQAVGADFAMPANGPYMLAVVTTATVAASAHIHMAAQLQTHYIP